MNPPESRVPRCTLTTTPSPRPHTSAAPQPVHPDDGYGTITAPSGHWDEHPLTAH